MGMEMLLSHSASNTSRHQQPRQLPGREEQPSSTSPTTTMASRAPLPSMNPWEAQALTHSFPDGGVADRSGLTPKASFNRRPDPLIFPGLYCSSGFDIISILLQLRGRPDPDIDLGAVDCSVSLTLCDLEQPDTPIVYASPSFCELTGYSMNEVLGRNCRFLQSSPTASSCVVDRAAIKRMSQAVRGNQEIQLGVRNYKKNGQPFTNMLSIIPLTLGADGHRYAVGLQCEM